MLNQWEALTRFVEDGRLSLDNNLTEQQMRAVAMGRRNEMDLSIGIALGSCIQIALFVAPLLVLLGGLIGPQPFSLSFTRGEMGFLFVSVLLGGLVASDGRSNWFKGVQLLAVYVLLALVCYLVPSVSP